MVAYFRASTNFSHLFIAYSLTLRLTVMSNMHTSDMQPGAGNTSVPNVYICVCVPHRCVTCVWLQYLDVPIINRVSSYATGN